MSGAGKAAIRLEARAARALAHASGQGNACDRLLAVIEAHRGRPLAGYWPIRTEIDPRPAMEVMAAHGPVALPVVEGPGRPLSFRRWTPGAPLVPGVFGAPVPEVGEAVSPEILVVPLLAFTDRCERLGYGGGFYDRTLAALRARGPVRAVGFAFAAQRVAALPTEPTDERVDLVVTEVGVTEPKG